MDEFLMNTMDFTDLIADLSANYEVLNDERSILSASTRRLGYAL